jgi:K+-sensing histidine kinase KdpD
MVSDKPRLEKPWWLLPLGRLQPMWWIGIGAALVAMDYLLGPASQFPVIYVIPVTLAAWYSGKRPALAMAIAVPLLHIVFLATLWRQSDSVATLVAQTAMRGAVIIVMALWFARLSAHEQELNQRVETLEGLLRICSFCRKIRNEDGAWQPLERFVAERSNTRFSHGMCPTCQKTHYPAFQDDGATVS